MAEPKNEKACCESSIRPAIAGPCRQSARDVLISIIDNKEKELNALHTLHSAINWSLLSREQEEQLWNYFISRR